MRTGSDAAADVEFMGFEVIRPARISLWIWEILTNPPGGYGWMFERGDQEGLEHMSRKFERPESTRRRTKTEV